MLRFFENFDLGEIASKRKLDILCLFVFLKIFNILEIRENSFVVLLTLRHFI